MRRPRLPGPDDLPWLLPELLEELFAAQGPDGAKVLEALAVLTARNEDPSPARLARHAGVTEEAAAVVLDGLREGAERMELRDFLAD